MVDGYLLKMINGKIVAVGIVGKALKKRLHHFCVNEIRTIGRQIEKNNLDILIISLTLAL